MFFAPRTPARSPSVRPFWPQPQITLCIHNATAPHTTGETRGSRAVGNQHEILLYHPLTHLCPSQRPAGPLHVPSFLGFPAKRGKPPVGSHHLRLTNSTAVGSRTRERSLKRGQTWMRNALSVCLMPSSRARSGHGCIFCVRSKVLRLRRGALASLAGVSETTEKRSRWLPYPTGDSSGMGGNRWSAAV